MKINTKIKWLIEKSVLTKHRSMFFLHGKHCTEQVMFLHHLLLVSRRDAGMDPPSVLWCFKKKLFSNFNEKRIKKLRKKYQGSPDAKATEEDIFDHFVIGAKVQFCHYSDSSSVLGQTFGMVVLQDFGALTPNTLARTVECAEGGGAVIFLLPSSSDPRHIATMHMEAHERFVTAAFPRVVPRFNRRLLLSLPSCPSCLLLDDQLQLLLLPTSLQQHLDEEEVAPASRPNKKPKKDCPPQLRVLLGLCRTRDQGRALLALAAGEGEGVVSLTAPRGRGKSAVLGLALALEGGRRVALTSPHAENVQTLFQFVIKGMEALDLKEGVDFSVVWNSECMMTGIKGGRCCSLRYLHPTQWSEGSGSDLVVVDEAAAIPLPLVKKWVKAADRVFMASTVNGYEGTGRSLSLKLINQLRSDANNGTRLRELELKEAVRYADGDPVEQWLDHLLCLHPPQNDHLDFEPPTPQQCTLYHVDRDLLFGGGAEGFLQQLVGLFVASHYNNSPNDLLMIADAPAHALYCLTHAKGTLYCVIQVAFEGEVSAETTSHRASGDMIPWVISQQFQDRSFASLRGARIVRIATRPDCQRMGYGRHALHLLAEHLRGSSGVVAAAKGNHLLTEVRDAAASLDYLGVSYGLTPELFRFWKRCGYVPLYIRQSQSEVTGEHTCMMVKGRGLPEDRLSAYYSDFVPRFLSLVATAFRDMPSALVLDVVSCHRSLLLPRTLSAEACRWLFPPESLGRLSSFCARQVELAAVADLLPSLARCHLMRSLTPTALPAFQEMVLVSVCLQGKSVDACAEETAQEASQVMGALANALRKILARIEETVKISGVSSEQNNHRHKKLKKFP